MGLPLMTQEEMASYLLRREQADAALKTRLAGLARLGVSPIPPEKYGDYRIRDGVRQCPHCRTILHHHPLGAVQIGDGWYSWLEVFDAVMGRVDVFFKESPMSQLNVGDVVRLKSGGPHMVITDCDVRNSCGMPTGWRVCKWIYAGIVESHVFPPECLESVVEGKS